MEMVWLDWLGWIGFAVTTLVVAVFAVTSLIERERRAFWVTCLSAFPGLGACLVILLTNFPGRDLMLAVLLGLGMLIVGLLLLPLGRNTSIKIVGRQERVDERDAVFHRFYRLKPKDPELEIYYRMHPEKKSFDEGVRAFPELDSPDSKSYHPINSSMQIATGRLTGELFADQDRDPEPLGPKRPTLSPERASIRIKGFARHLGADLVGCTRLNPAYIYSHIGRSPGIWGESIRLAHSHAVAIGVSMSHELVRHAPALPTMTETMVKYLEVGKIAVVLARMIRTLGYAARAHVDANYRVMCVPIAVDAGLGELGRHGLLICPKYGSRVRLAVVTTDLALQQDPARSLGVDHFCRFCKKCAYNCPSGSVARKDKEIYLGVEKWQTKPDTCYRYWRTQGTDCGICIKVCPYSHPDNPVHNSARWVIARNALARRLMLVADDLFYGRNPVSKIKPPEWHAE